VCDFFQSGAFFGDLQKCWGIIVNYLKIPREADDDVKTEWNNAWKTKQDFLIIITFAAAQYCGKFEDLKEEKMDGFFGKKIWNSLKVVCVNVPIWF